MKPSVLVTGASQGIGAATARLMSQEGAQVFVADINAESGNAVANEIGGRFVQLDVASESAWQSTLAGLERDIPRLDILVNNSGALDGGPLDELALETWKKVIDVNLTGAFLCTQHALKLMKSQTPKGGRIINNGSVSAQVPRPQAVSYTASKFGLTGLTQTTALEGRADSIACGQIDIGNADTDMGGHVARGMLQANGSIAPESTMHVDNVARGVAYMASLPLDANVLSLTVMANQMPLVGRG